jgi:hypothetical protein
MTDRYARLLTNLSHLAAAQRGLRLFTLPAIFLSLSACAEPSMAKHVLFSKISGRITVAGKPVAGATVKRWYRGGYNDNEATDTATTDTSGSFSFPLVTFSSITAGFVPHEPVITQKMFVVISGTETLIYATVKRNYDNNGEYGGQPLDFVFDPAAEPTFVGPSPTIRVTLSPHPPNP